MDGMPLSLKIKSYLEDLVYLMMNKTFVLATLGFTSLCFTTGALSWWGGHLIEDSIIWRNYTGSTLPSDPPVDKLVLISDDFTTTYIKSPLMFAACHSCLAWL